MTAPDESAAAEGEPGEPRSRESDGLVGDITQLLVAAREGEAEALGRLLPLVYELLREQARRALASERSGHTLQPTALVHEAWMRLARQREAAWGDRHHFLATAAMMMRRILVSHARGKRRLKRGGNSVPMEFDHAFAETLADPDAGATAHDAQIDLIALDEALTRLAALDARLVRTVELRYFAGLSVEETSEVLGVGSATVKRDWAFAKAWLREHLDPDGDRS